MAVVICMRERKWLLRERKSRRKYGYYYVHAKELT
jgi:hypothetical protein